MSRASTGAWRYSVGKGKHRVSVFELASRKFVLYRSWPDPSTGKARHESLERTLRTSEGRIIKEVERWAKAQAQEKYEQLVAGKVTAADARALPATALTLSEGLARAIDPRTGKYPTNTKHRRNVEKECKFAIAIWQAAPIPGTDEPWGTGRTWNSITRADVRLLGRARIDSLLATKAAAEEEGESSRIVGYRQAEFALQAVNAVARWLRDEQLIDDAAAVAPAKWKEELTTYWIEVTGSDEAPVPAQPRYTLDELRRILARTLEVDPRLHLITSMGVEQRLGQVHRCKRTQLTLPRAMDPKEQRDVEYGELKIPGRGKKRTPVLELTDGQLQVVRDAMGETGYLRELEAAYQRGELRDYPLFPADQLPGGRHYLSDGRKRDPRTPEHPVATVERHGKGKSVGMRAVQDWWREAEGLAGVDHVEGRGPYGGRRVGVDTAKELGISREGLMSHGGWSDTQMPDNVYADKEDRAARSEARRIRAQIRGEKESNG